MQFDLKYFSLKTCGIQKLTNVFKRKNSSLLRLFLPERCSSWTTSTSTLPSFCPLPPSVSSSTSFWRPLPSSASFNAVSATSSLLFRSSISATPCVTYKTRTTLGFLAGLLVGGWIKAQRSCTSSRSAEEHSWKSWQIFSTASWARDDMKRLNWITWWEEHRPLSNNEPDLNSFWKVY